MKFKHVLVALLATIMLSSVAFAMVALPTPAGTEISNFATGNYRDANGNAMASVTSNTVTTIVSQVAGVDLSPMEAFQNMVLYGTVSFPMSIVNTGNGVDSYKISNALQSPTGDEFVSTVYHDANGNGVVDEGEEEVRETPDMAMYTSYNIVVVVENISGEDASSANITLGLESRFNNEIKTAAYMGVRVKTSEYTFTMTADNNDPQPGDVVTYTLAVTNTGSADAQDVVFAAGIAVNTSYVAGSLKINGVAQSDDKGDDDAEFIEGVPSVANFMFDEISSGSSATATFQIVINDNVPVNTVIANAAVLLWKNILGEDQLAVSANASGATLTVAQIWFVAVGSDQVTVGDPSDYVYYAVTVTNKGNGPDKMNISEVCDLIPDWEFYLDANENGRIDEDEEELEDAQTATMAQGAVVYLVAKGQIPAGTPDEVVSVMTLTATSEGNEDESDEGELTITVTAPILSLLKAVSPTGNQPPGTVLTYTITILNVGTGVATDLRIDDDVPENTWYQRGTMKLGGVAKTDAEDEDEAQLEENTVVFQLPTLDAGASTTVEFKTKIQ